MVSLVEREETCPLTSAAEIAVLNFLKPCFLLEWRNGRRGRLKPDWTNNPCEFESHFEHHCLSVANKNRWLVTP